MGKECRRHLAEPDGRNMNMALASETDAEARVDTFLSRRRGYPVEPRGQRGRIQAAPGPAVNGRAFPCAGLQGKGRRIRTRRRRHDPQRPDLSRRGRGHRRRRRAGEAHCACRGLDPPSGRGGCAGRLRRAVRPEGRGLRGPGAGGRHRRRGHQAAHRHRRRPARRRGRRSRRHVRQRPDLPGSGAAPVPRLLRHRQAFGGRGRPRDRGHRRGLPAGQLRPDRRRDRRNAGHVREGRFRPRRFRRRRGGAWGHPARPLPARRRGARPRLRRRPFQRLLAGAPGGGGRGPRLGRPLPLRRLPARRGAADAHAHLCPPRARRDLRGRRARARPHHRRRTDREPAPRPAGRARRPARPLRLAPPPVFAWLRDAGGIEELELLRVFNCGVGLCLVVEPDRARALADLLRTEGETVVRVGEIVEGEGVSYTGTLA